MSAANLPHPLDRPVWNALTTRQAGLAVGGAAAVRFRLEINLFAAARDHAPESLRALADLLPQTGLLGLVEADPHPAVPGSIAHATYVIDQMVLIRLDAHATSVAFVPLGADDAPEMLALATRTAPGPFFAETWRQGGYIGVRERGRLVAMAGHRLAPPGFTEVSAVCTDPDFQGRGLARALMQAVIAPVVARGEAAFLHCYPENPAMRLYESLGFRRRRAMTYTLLSRDSSLSR